MSWSFHFSGVWEKQNIEINFLFVCLSLFIFLVGKQQHYWLEKKGGILGFLVWVIVNFCQQILCSYISNGVDHEIFVCLQIFNIGSKGWEGCGELWYRGCSAELKRFGSGVEWPGTHYRAEACKDTSKSCHCHLQDQGRSTTWDCCHTKRKRKHVLFLQVWFLLFELLLSLFQWFLQFRF